MARTTIDFGIDLGTTNSTIAVVQGTTVEVFKNNEDSHSTPSAVWIDKSNRLYVGKRAKERIENDSENAHCEFKLQMGTAHEYAFARGERRMRPEELSAEVLKALRADVRQRSGEDVRAAAITVPAAFELPQCDATRKAAELAGFEQSPLLQEPVAAALAYGFQSQSDKVFWLVYDFGGGTFDAAVIQVREGVIQVVNHGGDNHLGGKLIDWAIVDELLVPAVVRDHGLADFRRGNPKWAAALAKLKLRAEEAKVRCSRDEVTPITIENLCQKEGGEWVEFEYELRRADVERLMEPLVLRSINIAKKVLTEKRLAVANVEKVLLVGGPTLTPYLRQRLADPKEGLGIPLEFHVDPLTVVAQGAAIFAGTQKVHAGAARPLAAGQVAIELEYKPVGDDPEPLVGGKVLAPGLAGYTIEFANTESKPPWRSGRLPLSATGTFMTNLRAERGRANSFAIELRDASGNRREAVPDRLSYTMGLVITNPPIIHSVGLALANNEVQVFFPKGTPLPVKKRSVHKTAFAARKGQDDPIRIPVVEGENLRRADRNRLIGTLCILASQIKRDVPAGSEVEITIEIDSSRIVRTRAYIPILDEEYADVLKLEKQTADPERLRGDVQREKARLAEARRKTSETGDQRAAEVLRRVDDERMDGDVDATLEASRVDPDAADKCEKRLLDLRVAVDEAEDALEWPLLVAKAKSEVKGATDIVGEHGKDPDRQRLAALEQETRQAVATRNADLLRRKITELSGLTLTILKDQPGFWLAFLEHLEKLREQMRDRGQAEQLYARGHRAIQQGDVPGLRTVVQQLMALLPTDQQEAVRKGFGSSVV